MKAIGIFQESNNLAVMRKGVSLFTHLTANNDRCNLTGKRAQTSQRPHYFNKSHLRSSEKGPCTEI